VSAPELSALGFYAHKLERLLGITVEEDYGGLAMGYQAHCTVMEEISRASGTTSSVSESLIAADFVR
jgi:alkylation response protein AidB-like acyl-CoA dehydrogenase